MNQHLITLKMWRPDWDNDDDVDLENRSSLTESLHTFIMNPFGSKTFKSYIPFRMSGLAYGHPKFEDGQPVLTEFVREVRRKDPIGRTATFEFDTWSNHSYEIEVEFMRPIWH